MYYRTHKANQFNNVFKPIFDEIVNEINRYDHNHNRPAANIIDSETDYSIHLFTPGFNKADFKVELNEEKLVVSAEAKNDAHNNYKLQEYKLNGFSRTFVLPRGLDTTDIKASYEQGVLQLVFAKAKEAQARKIEIL